MKKLEFEKLIVDDPNFDKEVVEILAGIKADADVYLKIKKLGLTNREVKANLAKIIDYQDDIKVCRDCPGLSSCPKERAGYVLELSLEKGKLKSLLTPCPKFFEWAKIERQYIKKDFPEEWKESNLKQIDPSVKRKNVAIQMARLAHHDDDHWLYLLGNKGCGKSYLMAVFSNLVAKNDPGIAFVNWPETVALLRGQSIEEKSKFANNMHLLSNASLLVLDQFGDEDKTKYTFETILEPIIQYRLSNNLLTAFTSRYSLEYVIGKYAYRIGYEKAKEFLQDLSKKTGGEYDISGVNFYSKT